MFYEYEPLENLLQSTSLLRGKTYSDWQVMLLVSASIHFPLAREDDIALLSWYHPPGASIHFPLAREDM